MIKLRTAKEYASQTSSLIYADAKCEECKNEPTKWVINLGNQQVGLCMSCFNKFKDMISPDPYFLFCDPI